MGQSLFMFLAEGVAGDGAPKRAGARHDSMIFVPAKNIKEAQDVATTKAQERGWRFIELKRGDEPPEDMNDISDDVLGDAALSARDIGFGMFIHEDEITPNA